MNGHCTARGLAGIYAAVLRGEVLPAALLDEAMRGHSDGEDRVLLQPTTFGLGFMCSRTALPVGLSDASVGHAGAGGSVGFADPEAGVAFAFVMNRMRPGAVTGNDSALALVEALREALA